MAAVLRDPFTGIGKPEPLKYLAPGVWSRRDGNQKNQRRYRTQPQIPAQPAQKGDR